MMLARLFRIAMIIAMTTMADECPPWKCLLFDPCQRPEGALDGRWRLEAVNESPIDLVPQGFPIPDSRDFIKSGYLEFLTKEWDENTHTGVIFATYTTADPSGKPRPESKYTGSFEYHKNTGDLLLRAADSSRKASVIREFTIKAYGTLPKMGRSTVTFVKLKKP